MIKIAFLFLLSYSYIPGDRQPIAFDKDKVNGFFQDQQFDEAINYLMPILSRDSNNKQVLGYLGYANYMDDKGSTAEVFYQRIYTLDSNNIPAIRYLALLNDNKRPGIAKVYTLRLTLLQPGKAIHFRNMGDLLKRTDQKDSALSYYSHAYELDPLDSRNAAGLAEELIDMKAFSRADSVLEVQLAYDSLNISLLKLRVRASYEEKEYTHALTPGERLIRLNEVSLNSMTQLALSYYLLKKYNDCIRVCEYMLQNDLQSESIYYYEAKAYANLGSFSKSNELLEVCVAKAISTTAESYFYNLGQNYESLHQYRKAVAQYDTAYYLFKNPVMAYNCGRIYEVNLQNRAMAQKYYSIYLRTAKPQSPEEKKAYEFIRSRWSFRSLHQ
jgi:tetratricopeptide (TPR) repeat protein